MEEHLIAFTVIPTEHWGNVWSNKPIKWLNNCKIKRWTDVVQAFPVRDSVPRLIADVIEEQHEEWPYGENQHFFEISMRRRQHLFEDSSETPAS